MRSEDKPGISLETSEVFETSDLPESDQYYFPVEESDTIETIHVSTNQAFSRFKGTVVDNSSVDFSDAIRNTRRKGYIVWRGEPENKEEEPPVKKYQRLNCEIRELMDEIAEAKGSKDSELEHATIESLAAQVEILHKCLLELRMEDVVGAEALNSITDPQVALREQLKTEISEMKSLRLLDPRSPDSVNTQQPAAAAATGKKPSYHILMKPASQKLQASAEITSLVDRVVALERALGEDNREDMQIISMDTGRKTLTEAISVLSSKSTVLEPRNLDHIEGRLALLIQRLKDSSSESQSSASPEENETTMEKVEHLDKLVAKSDKLLSQVPDTIERLEALNPVHCRASALDQSIIQLEIVQKQLITSTSNNATLLKEIEKKMQENLSRIESNFDSLQARIDVVKANQKK